MRQTDYKLVQGVNQVVQMNPNIAAQSGNAMARLGQQLAQTGQDVSKIMEDTVRADEETKLLRMQQKWKEAHNKQIMFQMENPNDPLAWQDHRAKMMPSLEAYNNEQKFYTKEGRRAKEHAWLQWGSNTSMEVDRLSQKRIFMNRVDVGKVRFDSAIDDNDIVGARRELEGIKPYINAEIYNNGLKAIDAADYKSIMKDVKSEVDAEPETAAEKINNGTANFANIKDEDKNHWLKYAESARIKKAQSQVDELTASKNQEGGLSYSDFLLNKERGHYSAMTKGQLSGYEASLRREEPTSMAEWKMASDKVDALEDMQRSGATDAEIAVAQQETHAYVSSITPTGATNYLMSKVNLLNPEFREKERDKFLKGNKANVMKDAMATLKGIQATSSLSFSKFGSVYSKTTGKQIADPESDKLRRDTELKFSQWLSIQDHDVSLEQGRAKVNMLLMESNVKSSSSSVSDWMMPSFLNYSSGTASPKVKLKATPKGSHKKESSIPYNGTDATIRYNNPLGAWPSDADNQFGILGYGNLKDGEGNKIGRFPSVVHGAAANLNLLRRKYKGLTMREVVDKWRGRKGTPVPLGLYENEVLDDSILNNKARTINLLQQMAKHESRNFEMTESQWEAAYEMESTVQ